MSRDTEGSLQHVVSAVLRLGVVVSVLVGVLAFVSDLVAHSGDRVSLRPFRGTPESERHVGTILAGALHGDPRALMMVALLLLLLTPIVRVAVSLVGFIRERDRVYVAVTAVVLLTLLGSILLGGKAE